MLTYQDYLSAGDIPDFITRLIAQNEAGETVRTAHIADCYDRQRNVTIERFVAKILTESGAGIPNPYSANNRIASNFFNRLNTQRAMYSLGNGVTLDRGGDALARLDADLDTKLRDAGYLALIHGVSYLFYNVDRVHVFPATEFAPLWDEDTGALRGGVRYWRIDNTKPMHAVLYTEAGYAVYRARDGVFALAEAMRPYKMHIARAPADAEGAVIGGENYAGRLPIVPLWGSRLHQSTLVGMRAAIDSYDLVRSGFANDVQDCAQVFWILENYGGMRPEDLAQFRARLLTAHIAAMDTGDGGKLTPYTQEIPYQARGEYLALIRKAIYEDFGGVDVLAISAANQTATAIEAAYQPLDENADDFEYQIITAVRALLALIGADGVPIFKRNRVCNRYEQAKVLEIEAQWLDDETVLAKLPDVTADEVSGILARRKEVNHGRNPDGQQC